MKFDDFINILEIHGFIDNPTYYKLLDQDYKTNLEINLKSDNTFNKEANISILKYKPDSKDFYFDLIAIYDIYLMRPIEFDDNKKYFKVKRRFNLELFIDTDKCIKDINSYDCYGRLKMCSIHNSDDENEISHLYNYDNTILLYIIDNPLNEDLF